MGNAKRLLLAGAAMLGASAALAADSGPPSTREAVMPMSMSAVTSLQTDVAEALRRKVLVQCGLDGSRDRLPWYFHFEYGRALLQAGDARRAIPELARSVDLNPRPRADKRLYGMWFTDYLPYFQLADAHARLDNWPCAEQALQLSRTSGELALGRLDPARVRALQEKVDANALKTGACNARDLIDTRIAARL